MSDLDRCLEFETRVVSDDPADRGWVRAHAAECPDCAARLTAFDSLALEVEQWRTAAPEPTPGLQARILESVATNRRASARRQPGVRRSSSARGVPGALRRAAPWLAAAAGLVLAAGVLVRSEVFWHPAAQPSSALLVERALHEAEIAEGAHARAIAQLEEAAAPMLARAGDPALPPRQAQLLLSYRDRLRFLDRTVAEVDGFLAQNPNHAQARTVLLAAYVEKTEVLREVLALEPATGGRS